MAKTNDPGLGSKFGQRVERLINEDGTYNIKRHGGLRGVRDIYKVLINLSWFQFIGLSFIAYLILNCLFAGLYLLNGIDQIAGINEETPSFFSAFFFSVQTITSVGYGQLSPIGTGANIIATVESFIGLMSIALITGLLYGRFSKPVSKIAFTHNIILSPFNEGKAVMFKMVNQRNSILLNATVKVMLILDKKDAGDGFSKEYFLLPLQIDKIHFFPLTWTIVHPIDEESPLYRMDAKEIQSRNAEVIVLAEAFDETHSQNVMERHSYAGDQWRDNVKFARNFRTNNKGEIELFIKELDSLIEI